MFFRLKTTASGQALQLVESFRNAEGKSRQRLVVSLGDLEIPQKCWRETARAVEESLYGVNQPYLLPPCFPAELEKWVGHITKRVEREGRWAPVKRQVRHHKVSPDLVPPEDFVGPSQEPVADVINGVIASAVGHTHTTSLGPVLAGLHAWNELGMLEQLRRAGDGLDLAAGRPPLVVMDSGIATESNRKLLRDNGFSYLVNNSRPSRLAWREQFCAAGFQTVPGRDQSPAVEVRTEVFETHLVHDDHTTEVVRETLAFCRSAGRREKESAIRSRAEERFLEDLNRLQKRVEGGGLKVREKIERAIGRVLARHPRVARYYTVDLVPGSGHTPTLRRTRNQITWQDAEALDGCYVLRTNAMDLNSEDIWELYMTLARAENGFRMLKGDLGLRPNYHQLEDRVDAHIFITVLAFQLLTYIEHKLARTGDTRTWPTLRRVLQTHCFTTVLLTTIDGALHRLRRPGTPEPEQQRIYRALGLSWQRLPTSDIVVQTKNGTETL